MGPVKFVLSVMTQLATYARWTWEVGSMPLFGVNQKSGNPVFFDEYMRVMKSQHPNATEDQIRNQWVTDYGRT